MRKKKVNSNVSFVVCLFVLELFFLSCINRVGGSDVKATVENVTNPDTVVVYKSNNLIIKKISKSVYEHISFMQTDDFGKVSCNGMVVTDHGEAVVFDTPASDQSSEELIDFFINHLNCTVKAVVPTHFHEDCVGGLAIFNKNRITTYASNKTVEHLEKSGRKLKGKYIVFDDNIVFNVGTVKVYAEYYGPGHTNDNIIGSFPDEDVVFGGCLIKEVGANKGYLGDANVEEWSNTVVKLKSEYPKAKIVIPGHGKVGGSELFDYTVNLFKHK